MLRGARARPRVAEILGQRIERSRADLGYLDTRVARAVCVCVCYC